MMHGLIHDERGGAMVEFALLAPMFFLLLFGTIESARLAYTRQTLDEIAYSSARCLSVSTACDGTSALESYAVDRASSFGLTLASAGIAPQENVTCNGFPNSSEVTITHTFHSVMDGFVPVFPAQIQVKSCFPTLS